jgi:nucleotide-binding universal stress UspA family protein
MYKRLLGPLDGSKLSECSLEHIKAIAKGCEVPEVVLLTVIEEPDILVGGYASREYVKEEVNRRDNRINEMKKGAEDYLTKVAEDLRKENISVKTEVIQSALHHGAADEILAYAQNNKVDLVIMSTHGRSGISRWAFGSVTDKVISHTKVPVLTTTPAGCRIN